MFARVTTICAAVLLSGWLCASAQAEAAGPVPIYRFDPALSLAGPPLPALSSGGERAREEQAQETSLRLQTEGPLTPYVGAERGPELSPEEVRLLPEFNGRGALGDYSLEAGIGLQVEDNTSINLGYRFHTHPSLLDERRNDPLSLSGDLRVTFDIKVPFD